jgi:type IX secretion system PorP/SprF family membrane protein
MTQIKQMVTDYYLCKSAQSVSSVFHFPVKFLVHALFVLFFISCFAHLSAQEIHFSQFYNAPFLVNPAFSGNAECRYLIGINYRSQGNSWSVPYVTQSAYADARIYPSFSPNGWFGAGAWFYGDKAGDGALRTTFASLHMAYTMNFDEDGRFAAALGFSGGWASKSVDIDKLLFESQWTGTSFDNSINTDEDITNENPSYFDLNAGLLFLVNLSPGVDIYLGASMFHLNNPPVSFYDTDNRIDQRILIHGGGTVTIQENLDLEPAFYYSTQYGTNEIVAGANAAYGFSDLILLGGIWGRFSGDVIPAAGLEYKGFRLLMSYDVNVSRARQASNYMGGFEFSLKKNICFDQPASRYKAKSTRHGKPQKARSRYDKCRNFEYD